MPDLQNLDGTPLSESDRDRFWAKVNRRGPDECWPWLASGNGNGYGKFWLHGRRLYAHRIAYEMQFGNITPGLFVMHSCDNPPCCNARHLSLGTPHDNLMDMSAKGRHARSGIDHCKEGHLLEGHNLIKRPEGGRRCRTCQNQRLMLLKRRIRVATL